MPQTSTGAFSSSAPSTASGNVANSTGPDPLPAYEELTPDIMEDECLRGDVMLRWGAMLLALLLSATYITETHVLVEIRSGEYLASHGFLPPRTDPLGSSTGERPWVNLGWLSDLFLGIVHRGGPTAITLYGAATTFLAFQFLTRTNLTGVTTWWGSICAGLAAVALFPQLQPGTMSVTIVGLAILYWLLHRWRENPTHSAVWQLPVLFLVWSNMDHNAYLGLFLLLAFGMGSLLTGPPDRKVQATSSGIQELWLQIVLSALAVMVHPWHWHALESAWVQLKIVPAELRAYGGISDFLPRAGESYLYEDFWRAVDPFELTTLLLAALALLMQVLNLARFDGGLCLAWMVSLACGAASGALFTYTAVASAVTAALAGQDWYRHNFSQGYSVRTLAVLYSRLGRALTVLAGFALAYTAVNGMLMGPGGRRLGFGLDPRWQNRIEGVNKVAVEDALDDRPFPFRVDQGDLLLWLGHKPFVDSRLAHYALGGENLLQLHRDMRLAVLGSPPAAGAAPLDPKAILDKYQITHVVARLWTPSPNYDVLFKLLMSPQEWSLTGMGGAAATFYRTNTGQPAVDAYWQKHDSLNFIKQAYRDEAITISTDRFDTPRAVAEYERWLYQPIPELTPEVQEAEHYLRLMVYSSQQGLVEQTMALAYITQRLARRGLAKDPSQVQGWRIIAQSQSVLLALETSIIQRVPAHAQLRMHAALASTVNAVQTGGEQPADLEQLAQLHLQAQRADTALRVLKRFEQRTNGRLTLLPESDPNAQAQEEANRAAMKSLQDRLDEVTKIIKEAEASQPDKLQLVMTAVTGNCPLLALELMERDLTSIGSNPAAGILYGSLLMEAGFTGPAWQHLEGMERQLPRPPVPDQAASLMSDWYRLTATANFAIGNIDRAGELLQLSNQLQNGIAVKAIINHPFGSNLLPMEHAIWPAESATVAVNSVYTFPENWANHQFQQALLKIESGHVQEATKLLRHLLVIHPEWSQRVLAVYYLAALTGEEIPLAPPSDEIPVTPELFAPDEPVVTPPPTETPPTETPATSGAESAKRTIPAVGRLLKQSAPGILLGSNCFGMRVG